MSNREMRMGNMYLDSGGRAWSRNVVLLIIALGLASWVMYRGVTEFEVAIDHGASPPSEFLVVGVLAAGEVVGILLACARRKLGLLVAILAGGVRALVAFSVARSFSSESISAMLDNAALLSYWQERRADMFDHVALLAVVDVVILGYVRVHFDDWSSDVRTGRLPTMTDVEVPLVHGAQGGSAEVFLSYSRRQFYFAESLMLRLRASRVPVWFDSHRIQAGDDWQEGIDEGLARCVSLVLVASRDALTSVSPFFGRSSLVLRVSGRFVLFERGFTLPSSPKTPRNAQPCAITAPKKGETLV